MKKMTCNQLGGACEKEFTANTFEEMAELSKERKDDQSYRYARMDGC